MANSTIRVAFTAGGSGGHVFPLLAILEGIQKVAGEEHVGVEVHYFGPDDKSIGFLDKSSLQIHKIIAGNGGFLGVCKTFLGIIQSLWLLLSYMPDVVFSKGSYGSLPIVIVAWLYRIPVVIHESDSIPGNANFFAVRFAKKVMVSFEHAKQFFKTKEPIMVGNPLRMGLYTPIAHEEAKKHFGFSVEKPLILVLGGSQGAVAINDFIVNLLPQLLQKTQVLHQVGSANYGGMRGEVAAMEDLGRVQNKDDYKIVGFLEGEEYHNALYAADLVISRAGAGVIFELAALNKPAILIPISGLANDHQLFNAQEYAEYGGAEIFEQANLLPHLFLERLFRILDTEEVRTKMVEGAKKFAAPHAAEQIAWEILLTGAAH
ncbi:MAG: UDP-N-acetylglucosamine--N-acetylmuramyl-(pentapeptide) pyrophosphoryl-undecaprenol N-acetylglucosamine transferase [Parcubacteria group bacterium]|nr:UDP-N-acetylglucosamine--N-acetylmuramyl-(pentapeptide) pyrophosphoryl-undecaprenol N-acetylglucosamine transferase [Parcubacteria group bacterium]